MRRRCSRPRPLEIVAESFALPGAGAVLAIGAVTAMFGVLLNLLLGLSRALLAMGRRGDMPHATAHVGAGGTPVVAVIVMGVVVAALALVGDVRVTWSFSAFTVLIYYALTNLAALRLSDEERFYPRLLAWLGLAACLFLAFWVETRDLGRGPAAARAWPALALGCWATVGSVMNRFGMMQIKKLLVPKVDEDTAKVFAVFVDAMILGTDMGLVQKAQDAFLELATKPLRQLETRAYHHPISNQAYKSMCQSMLNFHVINTLQKLYKGGTDGSH